MLKRRLNPQAILLEDAQTEIKLLISNGYFTGKAKQWVRDGVEKIIKRVSAQLTNEKLRRVAITSLWAYSTRCWAFLLLNFGASGVQAQQKIEAAQEVANGGIVKDYYARQMGIPNQKYAKEYISDVVNKIKELADIEGLDPDDADGRNSLRNRAEIEVRQQFHDDQISEFKAKGTNLVVCSVHADCSKRCEPLQGKVYSLDHTSGRTTDGRSYQPLENATDVFVVSARTGKSYKNGLLGFNCRHWLYAYTAGMAIPKFGAAEIQKERKVNAKQRQMESTIRQYRERALYLKARGLAKEASSARKKAIEWNAKYKAFSERNGRAYYEDRVRILFQ